MSESEFCRFVLREPLWITGLNESSFGDRPKLISALRKLIKRAGDDLNQLGEAFIFAPPKNQTGAFFHESGAFEHMIYLSPFLDDQSQRSVDYSVAHEFGHAVAHATGADQATTDCVCGTGEDCNCYECECEGCHNVDMELTPDFDKTPADYINSVPEYAADTLVLQWGYKLPAWKAKLRAAERETAPALAADPSTANVPAAAASAPAVPVSSGAR